MLQDSEMELQMLQTLDDEEEMFTPRERQESVGSMLLRRYSNMSLSTTCSDISCGTAASNMSHVSQNSWAARLYRNINSSPPQTALSDHNRANVLKEDIENHVRDGRSIRSLLREVEGVLGENVQNPAAVSVSAGNGSRVSESLGGKRSVDTAKTTKKKSAATSKRKVAVTRMGSDIVKKVVFFRSKNTQPVTQQPENVANNKEKKSKRFIKRLSLRKKKEACRSDYEYKPSRLSKALVLLGF